MTSFFGIKHAIFAFFLKTTRRISAKFFLEFKRKHLFITTCIEKQCTQPLRRYNYSVSMSLFFLSHNLVYLLYFCHSLGLGLELG